MDGAGQVGCALQAKGHAETIRLANYGRGYRSIAARSESLSDTVCALLGGITRSCGCGTSPPVEPKAPADDGLDTVRLEGAPPQSADVSDNTPGHSLGRFSHRRWGDSGNRGQRAPIVGCILYAHVG
jgi:hypothetical protein